MSNILIIKYPLVIGKIKMKSTWDSTTYPVEWGFSDGASGKEYACQCRRLSNMGSIPGSGRSPGGEHGNPLQCSCLENSVDRRTWRATIQGVPKNWTQLGE